MATKHSQADEAVHKRLLNVHPDAKVAERLASHGLRSANHVARVPRKEFVSKIAGDVGLGRDHAEAAHRRATAIRNKTMQLWASLRGTVRSPFFSNSVLDTVDDELRETFQDLPSYQDLFGSLDYCACDECRSIFGPAAYLVDLLRIIDEYVTKPNKATIDSAFLFTTRRPDIGKIELTCASTDTNVPYLQVVNERLLATAQQSLGAPNTAAVLQQMATALVYPQALPFNAPLDRVRVLLDKVGVSYGGVLAAWDAPTATVAARSLELSVEQQTIVTTPQIAASAVAPFYNVAPSDIDTLSDAETYLAKTWSTFADLQMLVTQDLSPSEQAAGLQANFFINQDLGGKWIALTQPKSTGPYVLTNLDVKALDRMNWLLRLADRLAQPASAVDWALRCVQAGGAPAISKDALVALFHLRNVGSALTLNFADSAALLGPIKTYGQGTDGAGTQFDQLFNPPAILAQQGPYHPSGNPLNPGYRDDPLPWTPGSNLSADVSAITRVLPGLGLTLSDAGALGTYLYSTTAVKLTVTVLSALYRHALLSRALQLPMSQYLVLLKLKGPKDPIAPIAVELDILVSAARWLNEAGITVYQLDYVINGAPASTLIRTTDQNCWINGSRGCGPSFPRPRRTNARISTRKSRSCSASAPRNSPR